MTFQYRKIVKIHKELHKTVHRQYLVSVWVYCQPGWGFSDCLVWSVRPRVPLYSCTIDPDVPCDLTTADSVWQLSCCHRDLTFQPLAQVAEEIECKGVKTKYFPKLLFLCIWYWSLNKSGDCIKTATLQTGLPFSVHKL